jgi:hypothetical protein
MHRAVLTPSNHPRYAWVVTWREAGERRVKYYADDKKAKKFVAMKNAELMRTAPDEIPVTDEERRVVMLARDAGVPLAEAVTAWHRSHGKAHGINFGELIDARLTAAESDASLSWAYRKNLKCMLTRAAAVLGELPAADVGSAEVGEVVALGKSGSWQRSMRAMLSGVFNQAIRAGVLSTNYATLARVMRDKRPDGVGILTPAQAGRLLREVKGSAMAAPVAIQLFAGLRRAEAMRLDWSEVKLARGFIEVTAGKSKTVTRRLVTIQPNLAKLLARLAQQKGRVWTVPERDWKRWHAKLDLPPNGMRHSFVSYHLALFGDLNKTELEAGHDRKV